MDLFHEVPAQQSGYRRLLGPGRRGAPTVNAYSDANKEAGAAGRTIEVEPAGKLWTQLGTIAEDGTLAGSGPLTWEVGTSGSTEPIVADILRRIKTATPAALDREMSRPLVPPTPVDARPFRAQPARRPVPT